MKIKNSLILISFLSIIFIYGCTTNTEYVPLTKVESTSAVVEKPTETTITTISEQEREKENILISKCLLPLSDSN